MSGAYYNEFDPKAAAWLRELVRRNLIAPGDVDERSIEDIAPYEIAKYTQCHFFAGIGVWSYALRAAGWADTRPVWTGSCPCQPLSQAGKGLGFADERHLWPAWEHLIRERRPPVLFGEQVASKAAGAWADLVQDDLEALGYAFGAVPFPAASVGAPHIRDRLYWCASHHGWNSDAAGIVGRSRSNGTGFTGPSSGVLAHHHQLVSGQGRALAGGRDQGGHALARPGSGGGIRIGSGRLADHDDAGRIEHPQRDGESLGGREEGASGSDDGRRSELGDDHGAGLQGRSLPAGGRSGECTPWTPSDFVWCRDGKWRPVEPGTFPLAHGAPARVGRLRGYGNAIVSEAAKVFIEASGLV